jgi:hypothetical protein
MNDFAKTAVAIVLAAGLAGAAYVTAPHSVVDATFSDQGEVFFPAFTDPLAAKSLEVISYDEPTATLTPFKVKFDGTRWVIPSHHNYPADAEANMSGAASAFIGLKKDAVVTDKASEHQALGVLSPDDDKAPLSGRGTRVTLKGASGDTLADLIIGKPVKGAMVGGQVYARVPGKNRVYAVAFTRTVTSKFEDWVQTDVLKVGGTQPIGMTIDRYQIDEQAGTKTTTETLTISKAPEVTPPAPVDPNSPPPVTPRWTFAATPGGGPAPGETVNEAPIDEAFNTLRSMRIVGVRPKPEKLVKFFGGGEGASATTLNTLDLMNMGNKGFFVDQKGNFLANEGEADIRCDDGVVYKLYFGELLLASGDALSAGSDDVTSTEKKPDTAAGDKGSAEAEKKPEAKKAESRYMLATVTFDPSVFGPAPVMPVEPKAPEGFDPAKGSEPTITPAPTKEGEPVPTPPPESPEVTAYKVAKAKFDSEKQAYIQASLAHSTKIDAGKKRAETLRKNLANWYYVIDAAAFEKLRPTRAALVKKPDAPAEPMAPAAIPGH